MPWISVRKRPEQTTAIQYNPPEEPVSDLVIDNDANQKVMFTAQGVVGYIAPGDWIVDIPTGYRILKDKDFRREFMPEDGEWPSS